MKSLPIEDLDHIQEHTRPLWETARGQRFFISGGTGFFGAWLLESLAHCDRMLGLDVSAIVLSRNPGAFLKRMPHLANERTFEWLQGDVRDFAFPGDDFDYVIHAATSTSRDAASRPAELRSTLVDGTERMLFLAKERQVKGLLLTSSGAVYGRQPENMSRIPEDYLGNLDGRDSGGVYGEGKRASEEMCARVAKESGMRVTIARCFAFVGPHLPLNQHFAIGNFIRDALNGKNIAIRGDGTPMRSYLYAADLAIWLWTMLLRAPNRPGNPAVFNVGSGSPISILDLARTVAAELNPSLKIDVALQRTAGTTLEQYVPDVRKAENCLGLRAWIGLPEAVRRTAEWYRSD